MEKKEIKLEVEIPKGEDLSEEQKAKLKTQFNSAVVEAISGARAREGEAMALKAETSVKETEVPETKIQIPVPVTQKKESSIV